MVPMMRGTYTNKIKAKESVIIVMRAQFHKLKIPIPNRTKIAPVTENATFRELEVPIRKSSTPTRTISKAKILIPNNPLNINIFRFTLKPHSLHEGLA